MDHRELGRTGVRVSTLCFGTMSFGDAADEATSGAMYRRCREAGIDFFDCANVYAGGRSEEILGKLIATERSKLVITSKVGFPMGPGPNDQGLSRRHILSSVEASLKRLRTDWLDVLFLHRFDPATPIEESLRAVDQLVRKGKVNAVGVSNWAAWQIAKGLGLAALHDVASIACIQPMYSLAKRQAEVEILPLAQSERLGVITYSPLGGGLLSGKYGAGKRPETGRLIDNEMYRARYRGEAYVEVAQRLVTFARERGVHPATLAVAWVGRHPAVTAPIIGARNLDQLEPSLAAADFPLDDETYDFISALSPTPPPATDRSDEREGVAYRGSAEKYK